MPALRPFLLILSAVGSLFFSLLFAAALASPGFVEQLAREVIRLRLEARMNEKVDAIDARFLVGKAAVLAGQYDEEITRTRRQLKEGLPSRIAAVIAEMRNLDCECRRKVEKDIRAGMEGRIAGAAEAQERLTGLIRSEYMETSAKLGREFRIFTGTNALAFLLLGAACLARRGAGLLLLPAAAVLMAATVLASGLYLFGQDWLHTILFNDYTGFAFIGYVGAAFAGLADLFFNRGRLTAWLLNRLGDAVGSSVQVLPC